MSVGGAADEVNHNVRVIQLDARAELRVQVTLGGATQSASAGAGEENASSTTTTTSATTAGDVCWFKLISGTAEMFGTELAHVREKSESKRCNEHYFLIRDLFFIFVGVFLCLG
jgi:hypothetical protein